MLTNHSLLATIQGGIARPVRRVLALSAFVLLLGVPAAPAFAAPAASCTFIVCTPPVNFGPPLTSLNGQLIPLVNGGFEDTSFQIQPFAAQIQQHGWFRYFSMVLASARHHCGLNSLSTGGNWGGGGIIYTQVTLPANASSPVLYLNVDVESRVAANRGVVDTLKVYIDAPTPDSSPNFDLLPWGGPRPTPLATYSNLDSLGQGFVLHSVALPTTFRGQPIAAQTIQLWLIADIASEIPTAANNWNPITTNFYVDDVTLWTASPLFTLGCAA